VKTARLARRLGLDGNPLRRRTDKMAAWAAALLLAAFLIGAPLLSVAAVGWAGRAAAARLQAERSWHQVPAVLLQAVPPPAGGAGGLLVHSQVLARWTAPAGRARTGRIPVNGRLAAGRTVRLWVDAAGSPTAPPLNRHGVATDEVAAAVTATAALGTALLCLAWGGRWMLNRRRLAAWEAAWAAVGPQWTRRFRSRG
jgi:hypothetical protein